VSARFGVRDIDNNQNQQMWTHPTTLKIKKGSSTKATIAPPSCILACEVSGQGVGFSLSGMVTLCVPPRHGASKRGGKGMSCISKPDASDI
jgi:hypothetical protein